MGYRIEYDGRPMPSGNTGVQWGTAGKWGLYVFALFLAVTCAFWPDGRAMLGSVLFSGDAELTFHALENLTEQLREDHDLMEAVTAFCREIIGGAAGTG